MTELENTSMSGKQVAFDFLKVAQADVGGRIRAARQRKGLSLADLGKLVQRSSQAVQQYEVGQAEPGLARLTEMARHLGVDPFWLVFGVKAQIDADWALKARREAAVSEDDRLLSDFDDAVTDPLSAFAVVSRRRQVGKLRGRRLQVIKRVEMMPSEIAQQNFANTASSGDIVSHFDCSEDAFAFEISTKRNAPQFEPGDIVVIDRAQIAHPGAMVLVIKDGKLIFGQLSQRPDGAYELLSPNPMWQKIKLSKLVDHVDVDGAELPDGGDLSTGPAMVDGGNGVTWPRVTLKIISDQAAASGIIGVMVEHTTPRSERAAWGASAKSTE